MRLSVIVEKESVVDIVPATVQKKEGVWVNSDGLNIFLPVTVVESIFTACEGMMVDQSEAVMILYDLRMLVDRQPHLFNEWTLKFVEDLTFKVEEERAILTAAQKLKIKQIADQRRDALDTIADCSHDPTDDIPF